MTPRTTVAVDKRGVVEGEAAPEEDLERYRNAPDFRVEVFEDAGHEVFGPDYERFMRRVEGFLAELGGP